MNDVWVKMAEFLGRLNGESVSREIYVRTPECEKALEVWKGTGMGGLSGNPFRRTEGKAEGNKRVSGGLFFCPGELRAYIQGYVDCVQMLEHMGLLKKNKELKWTERII